MGLANDNTYGNKKSNFNYQERSIRILAEILGNTNNISQLISTPKSYSATMTFVPDASGATDVFQIAGAAGMLVKLRRIHIYATKTVASITTVSLVLRNTIDTGLTNSATIMKHDTTNPAPVASVKYTTTNPTLGTLVGAFRQDSYSIVATGSFPYELIYEYGDNRQQFPTLDSATSAFCVNFNGVTMVGGSVTIVVEWDEEAA